MTGRRATRATHSPLNGTVKVFFHVLTPNVPRPPLEPAWIFLQSAERKTPGAPLWVSWTHRKQSHAAQSGFYGCKSLPPSVRVR